ncbi:uncharacterized protein LOC131680497 [Topomyia yanbarensis]|uniref:uncharacterized protein LOC131680497 n=1 Tax=Topomyia yanbarensis TaxID=2498891 RepID=UPI00273CEED8|nr:uncharacterized protein LOC131680497 [Topomyia yanbarensis]
MNTISLWKNTSPLDTCSVFEKTTDSIPKHTTSRSTASRSEGSQHNDESTCGFRRLEQDLYRLIPQRSSTSRSCGAGLLTILRFRGRILWRSEPADPIQCYELLTVTYGLSPSSFFATRTLQQLANDEGDSYPLAGPAVRKSFYIDDFIGGAQSITEAIQLRTELSELLAKGGFPLRKWTSNQLSVLAGLSSDEIGTQSSIQFDKHETVKTLGISWKPEPDILRFYSEIRQHKYAPTKRSILSAISQLFDPLGLISPIVIKGKMLIKRLWLVPCAWDDEVPNHIATSWEK